MDNFKNTFKTILSTAAVISTLCASNANAMMLSGNVQTSVTGQDINPNSNQTRIVNTVQLNASLNNTEDAAATAEKFQGHWKCVTTVVASNVPKVAPGTRVVCDLTFQNMKNGEVKADWMQNGWTSSQSTVGKCSNGTLRLSHSNQFSRAWAAHAEDFAKVTSPTTMISTSIVDQYSNGALVGQYKTQSQLVKISG
jgi:hypothetical protein